MRTKQVVFLLLGVLLAVILSGCGGGGGGSSETPPPVAQFSVSASKALALADNTDTSVITAKFSGVIPQNGTAVTFTVSGPGTFDDGSKSSTGVIDSGSATTTVKSPTSGDVTITAASAGSTASTMVRFIQQPTSMKVSIALNPAVEALTSINFSLNNTPGATYTGTVTALNAASGLPIEAAQVSSDRTNVGFFTVSSINTGTTALVELTYAITTGSLPTIQVSSNNISANKLSDPSNVISPTVPVNLTPENFVVKVDYI